MEHCMQSFILSINAINLNTGTSTKTWTVGTETFFALKRTGSSVYNFQGFKNINLYGIDVIGGVNTDTTALTGGCVITDWNFEIFINGVLPLPNGFITPVPNDFGMQFASSNTRLVSLSKNTNSVKFFNPILSVASLNFEALNVQGIGVQTGGFINIDYDFSFIVYYKYEGED